MLTLINRELQDHAVYLLTAALIGTLTAGIMIYQAVWGLHESVFAFSALNALALLLVYCALGVAQMYTDRANRISSLLATLAVTRSQILTARVLFGLLTILLTLGPLVLTAVVVLHVFAPPLAFYRQAVIEAGATVVLTAVACYCMGLLIGWTTRKAVLLLSVLLLLPLVVPIFVVKGFGPGAHVILLVLIVASLVRLWHKFAAVSL